MPFTIHPDPPLAPFVAAPGEVGSCVFAERRGAADLMFVRVATSRGAFVPLLRLAAGDGDETVVPPGRTVPVHAGSHGSGAPVAEATCSHDPDGSLLLRVSLLSPKPLPWRLAVPNADSTPCVFTFVVADTDEETRQPWIDVGAGVLSLGEVPEGEKIKGPVAVANRGTGPLALEGGDLFPPDAGFRLTHPPVATMRPGERYDVGWLEFEASAPLGPRRASLVIRSNDTRARESGGHSRTRHFGVAVVVAARLYDVRLVDCGANKINVIKEIRAITGLGLKEAKALVEGAPKEVKAGVAKAEADEFKKRLEAAGAKVEITPSSVP